MRSIYRLVKTKAGGYRVQREEWGNWLFMQGESIYIILNDAKKRLVELRHAELNEEVAEVIDEQEI